MFQIMCCPVYCCAHEIEWRDVAHHLRRVHSFKDWHVAQVTRRMRRSVAMTLPPVDRNCLVHYRTEAPLPMLLDETEIEQFHREESTSDPAQAVHENSAQRTRKDKSPPPEYSSLSDEDDDGQCGDLDLRMTDDDDEPEEIRPCYVALRRKKSGVNRRSARLQTVAPAVASNGNGVNGGRRHMPKAAQASPRELTIKGEIILDHSSVPSTSGITPLHGGSRLVQRTRQSRSHAVRSTPYGHSSPSATVSVQPDRRAAGFYQRGLPSVAQGPNPAGATNGNLDAAHELQREETERKKNLFEAENQRLETANLTQLTSLTQVIFSSAQRDVMGKRLVTR